MSQHVVTATDLNIRTQPNTNSEIIKVVHQNDVLEVIGYSSDHRWSKIQLNGQNTAWAASSYLTQKEPGELENKPTKLLFSLDSFKSHHCERQIEQYFVTFLYDPLGKAPELPIKDDPALNIITASHQLKQWFLLGVTPIIVEDPEQVHTFPGGLPLYLGPMTDYTSVYVAAMESDHTGVEKMKKITDSLEKLLAQPESDVVMKDVVRILNMANPTIEVLKAAFSLAVKAVEIALLKNEDDIDYTEVFTFKQSNRWLQGKHSMSNQRVDLNFSVECV